MAEVRVEREERDNSWIWWVVGAIIIIALLAWWLIPGEEEPAPVPVTTVEPGIVPANPPPAEPVAQGPFTSISDLMANEVGAVGATFAPAAPLRVVEVISDRAFWVEDGGQRLLVVLNEGAPGAPQQADVQGQQAENPNVNPGETIRITEGVVQDPTFLQNLQGPVEPETRAAVNGQRIFLVTDGRNVQPAAGGV